MGGKSACRPIGFSLRLLGYFNNQKASSQSKYIFMNTYKYEMDSSIIEQLDFAQKQDLPVLAADAMKQARLPINNLRDLSEDDALMIYKAAL